MLSTIKSIGTKIVQYGLAGVSLLPSIGSGIFTSNKLFDFIAPNSSLRNPVAAFFGLAGYTIQLTTRVPSMVKKTADDKPCINCETDEDIQELSAKAKAAYYSLLLTVSMSNGFSSLFAYLSTITFAEYIALLFEVSIENQSPVVKYTIQGIGVLIFGANYWSYLNFNYEAAKVNAKKWAKIIDSGDYSFDGKAAAKTFGISFFNVASSPFLAYFSTVNGLQKLPIPFPASAKQIISGVSAVTYLTSILATSVPRTYDQMKSTRSTEAEIESDFACKKPLKGITYGFGFFDSIRNGIGNGMGVINTTADVFHADPYNPTLITGAILSTASTTYLALQFGILYGWEKTAKLISGKDDAEEVRINVNELNDPVDTGIEIDTASVETTSEYAVTSDMPDQIDSLRHFIN
jgi:hypothetical protein